MLTVSWSKDSVKEELRNILLDALGEEFKVFKDREDPIPDDLVLTSKGLFEPVDLIDPLYAIEKCFSIQFGDQADEELLKAGVTFGQYHQAVCQLLGLQ